MPPLELLHVEGLLNLVLGICLILSNLLHEVVSLHTHHNRGLWLLLLEKLLDLGVDLLLSHWFNSLSARLDHSADLLLLLGLLLVALDLAK